MALTPGRRFGSFDVLMPIGVGGMGEVYRARDTRLNRDVALKVLPQAVALDPDRLARFTREAQVLASLNHPNIAAIYGIEHADGQHALVLELVEGPTLGDRIADGALPVEEALPIAQQIAEAIEGAHACGIVHRDLKPANIKVRPDGTVKVLDFGLAKASDRAAHGASGSPDVTASPTLVSPAVTGAGIILGTAAYMAPEQARGRAVDHRADIWAFGCVLFEMLTRRRAFEGDVVTDTLAGILRAEPPWDALPASTPRSIRRLLRRCLEKDPRYRLQAIGDARIEIADALARRDDAGSRSRPKATSATRLWPVAVACAITAVVVGAAVWVLKPAARVSGAVVKTLIAIDPFDQRAPAAPGVTRNAVGRPDRIAIAISPDGQTIVLRAAPGGAGGPQLFVRSLDSLKATALTATTGAEHPFFSPDGKWIGYWADGELRRIPATTGASAFSTICKIPNGVHIAGASWGADDAIVFATQEGIWRVAASGGSPDRIVDRLDNEYWRRFPQVLPDGGTILFTVQDAPFRWDDAHAVVRNLSTGQEKELLDDAADVRYVATGHLVFMRRGKLMAVPFDAARQQVTGGAVAIVDGVMQSVNVNNTDLETGAGQYAVSAQGTLVYATGGVSPDIPREMVWVDRNGHAEAFAGAPQLEYGAPRISPKGSDVLVSTQASESGDTNRLWVYNLARQTMSPVTGREDIAFWALWSPDSTRIAFNSLAQRGHLMVKAADGVGGVQAIGKIQGNISSWSSDNRIAFLDEGDIWWVDMTGPIYTPQRVTQTPAVEGYPVFSPDAHWLAYVSNESGRPEVYAQPFPGPGPRVLISTGGGVAPTWGGDGRELFYYTADDGVVSMRAVPIRAQGSTLSAGLPVKLFEGRYITSTPVRGYDVTADGKRFIMLRRLDPPPSPPSQLVVVQNWFDELTRLAPRRN